MSPRIAEYTRGPLTFDVTDTGPLDGRAVILLHGFPEDRHCWDAVAERLVDAGYRVLAPDQRGYSPRARPAGRRSYALAQLDGDVMALADAAGAERFDLVGHDWGGAVAWDLAAKQPSRVRTLTALSTPHPRAFQASLLSSSQILHSWYMVFFQIPGLPETVLRLGAGGRMTQSLVRSGLDVQSAERYAKRFSEPGAMTGPVNWYRALPYGSRQPTPAVKVPTLYAWGDGDGFLTRRSAELTARFVDAPYRFEVLEGGSHWLPSGEAVRVSQLLLAHLGAHTD